LKVASNLPLDFKGISLGGKYLNPHDTQRTSDCVYDSNWYHYNGE